MIGLASRFSLVVLKERREGFLEMGLISLLIKRGMSLRER